jgi:hypothetical protein
MLRIFPAFPGGAPGAALLLLRLCTAFLLPLAVFNAFSPTVWLYVAVVLLAASLAAGIGVRLAAPLAAGIILLAAIRSGGMLEAIQAVQAVQSAALALLGAGAYSIDARLFGRRVIQLND